MVVLMKIGNSDDTTGFQQPPTHSSFFVADFTIINRNSSSSNPNSSSNNSNNSTQVKLASSSIASKTNNFNPSTSVVHDRKSNSAVSSSNNNNNNNFNPSTSVVHDRKSNSAVSSSNNNKNQKGQNKYKFLHLKGKKVLIDGVPHIRLQNGIYRRAFEEERQHTHEKSNSINRNSENSQEVPVKATTSFLSHKVNLKKKNKKSKKEPPSTSSNGKESSTNQRQVHKCRTKVVSNIATSEVLLPQPTSDHRDLKILSNCSDVMYHVGSRRQQLHDISEFSSQFFFPSHDFPF